MYQQERKMGISIFSLSKFRNSNAPCAFQTQPWRCNEATIDLPMFCMQEQPVSYIISIKKERERQGVYIFNITGKRSVDCSFV